MIGAGSDCSRRWAKLARRNELAQHRRVSSATPDGDSDEHTIDERGSLLGSGEQCVGQRNEHPSTGRRQPCWSFAWLLPSPNYQRGSRLLLHYSRRAQFNGHQRVGYADESDIDSAGGTLGGYERGCNSAFKPAPFL